MIRVQDDGLLILNHYFFQFVLAALLAFATAAPAPEPKPTPKPDPLIYSSGYVAAAPVAYSSYVSPVVSSYAYPAYAAYSAPLVYV